MSHSDKPVQYIPGESPRAKLSDYHFFKGALKNLNPNERVLPYDLISPLFTDYAEKFRLIWMPDNVSGIYNDSTFLDLPVGTVLIKNFYYPDDFRESSGTRRIIETRLMVHEPTGWRGLPYVWNDEQSEAFLSLGGGERDVEFINNYGEQIRIRYLIPNANQCQSCHFKNNKMVPVGIQARHLNRNFNYEGETANQLVKWFSFGFLSKLPDIENIPYIADYRDTDISTDKRARAYLDINCAHCHNSAGPGKTSGLFLHYYETNPASLGIMKPPVAAGRGSGGKQFSIVPGNPENSILLYRMESAEPGVMMPEIGRTVVDAKAVELIREWIDQMKPGL